ncbi:DNA-binding protein, partial [Paenibacillus farraposensis]
YSELGWFSGLDKLGWEEVERFKLFAKANLYTNDLLSGKLSVLSEYVQFLEDNPEELLPGLVTIMETASLHLVNVDDLLERFSEKIEDFRNLEDATNRTHYIRFSYHRAVYYTKLQRYPDCVGLILLFLTSYNTINDADFKKFVVLFEVYREYASSEQIEQYQNLCKELLKHEEGISICDDDIRSC